MKKCLTVCFVMFLSLLPAPAQAQTLPPEMGKGLEQAVSLFQKAFPAVELYVISLKEGKILLENSKDAELRPGLELSLFREGKEFTHPITGVTLGRFEEALGNLRLVEVKEDYCLAQAIGLKPGAEVKRGDKARITAGKIKLAVWGETALGRQLVYKLEASGRFLVISPGEFQLALDKLSIDKSAESLDKKQLQQLAQTLGIRGVVTVQVKDLGGAAWLESELLSTLSGAVMATASVRLLSLAVPAKLVPGSEQGSGNRDQAPTPAQTP